MYWSDGVLASGSERVLGAKAGKNLIYILSPLFPAGAKQGSFFLLLHYSITLSEPQALRAGGQYSGYN